MNYSTVLRNRDFVCLWVGQAISHLGDSLRHIALIWLVKEMTGSALAMGTVGMCAMIPYLALSLFAGALVDLVDRKKIMIWADVLRGGLTLALPILLFTGHLQFWHVCVMAFLLSSVSTLFGPAMMASLPNVVGKEQLLAANSMKQMTMQGAGIIGPALGGVIVGLAGTIPALVIDSVSFFVSAAAILAARIPGARPEAGREAVNVRAILGGVREGFGFIVSQKMMLAVVLIAVGLNFVGAPTMVLMAIHVEEAWGAGADGYGIISSAWSVGAFAGALAVGAVVARIRRDRVIWGSLVLQGVVLFGLVVGTNLGHGVMVFVVGGITNALVNIPFMTWAQEIVPDRIRGRVFSALEVGCMAAAPAALALAGTAADAFGTSAIFGTMAVATIIGGLALARVFSAYADGRLAVEPAGPGPEAETAHDAPPLGAPAASG